MFAYNPQTQDRSGEIRAAGTMSAANSIGSALTSIADTYSEVQSRKAKGKAFKDVFKVVAPSAGIDMKQLEELNGGSLKNDMDWYNASENIAPLLPSLINLQLGQMNNTTRRQGMGVQTAMPGIRAAATGAQNQASQGGPTQMSFPSRINPDVIP